MSLLKFNNQQEVLIVRKDSSGSIHVHIPSDLASHLNEYRQRKVILAHASKILKTEHKNLDSLSNHELSEVCLEALTEAIEEFKSDPKFIEKFEKENIKIKSWAGFYFATGGAILSVGLGAWLSAYYFVNPPFTFEQTIPFILLTLAGLSLIVFGLLEDQGHQ